MNEILRVREQFTTPNPTVSDLKGCVCVGGKFDIKACLTTVNCCWQCTSLIY